MEDIVNILASAVIATTESAMGKCLSDAAALQATLEGINWEIFELIAELRDGRKSTVDEIFGSVTQALRTDEHVVPLAPVLREAQAKALRLLRASTKPLDPASPPQEAKPTPKPGKRIVAHGSQENLGVTAAKDLLSNLERELPPGQSLHVHLSWIIEEDGTEQ